MGFKLGREKRNVKSSKNVKKFSGGRDDNFKGAPILKMDLDKGTYAEANMDGTISVSPDVNLNSAFGKRLLKHEKQHLDDIESGRAGFNDNVVQWEDKLYLRKEINGEKVIDGPNGRWPEGHPNHPWEQTAINAETE